MTPTSKPVEQLSNREIAAEAARHARAGDHFTPFQEERMTDHDDEEIQTESAPPAPAAPRDIEQDLADERALSAHLDQKIRRAREALQRGQPTHALDILT